MSLCSGTRPEPHSRDGMIVVLDAISDMVVTSEDQDGCMGVFSAYRIEDWRPFRCLISRRHMPNEDTVNQLSLQLTVSCPRVHIQVIWSFGYDIEEPRLFRQQFG